MFSVSLNLEIKFSLELLVTLVFNHLLSSILPTFTGQNWKEEQQVLLHIMVRNQSRLIFRFEGDNITFRMSNLYVDIKVLNVH